MHETAHDGQDRLRELQAELATARRRLSAALNAGEPDGDGWSLTPEAREAASRVRTLEDEARQLIRRVGP